VAETIRQGAFFASCGFQDRVGSDARKEMGTQISGEFGELAVAENLDGADDGGGIDIVTPSQLPGGEKEGVVRVCQDGGEKFLAVGVEAGAGSSETIFQFGQAGGIGLRSALHEGVLIQQLLQSVNNYHQVLQIVFWNGQADGVRRRLPVKWSRIAKAGGVAETGQP
jgi:hypothetical protein